MKGGQCQMSEGPVSLISEGHKKKSVTSGDLKENNCDVKQRSN